VSGQGTGSGSPRSGSRGAAGAAWAAADGERLRERRRNPAPADERLRVRCAKDRNLVPAPTGADPAQPQRAEGLLERPAARRDRGPGRDSRATPEPGGQCRAARHSRDKRFPDARPASSAQGGDRNLQSRPPPHIGPAWPLFGCVPPGPPRLRCQPAAGPLRSAERILGWSGVTGLERRVGGPARSIIMLTRGRGRRLTCCKLLPALTG